jgi:hypothetical protein
MANSFFFIVFVAQANQKIRNLALGRQSNVPDLEVEHDVYNAPRYTLLL